MTIETTNNSVTAVSDGNVTVYNFDFQVISDEDLAVFVNGLPVSENDFSVAISSDYVGGTVTFNTAPAVDSVVEIARAIEHTQTTELPVAGPFPAPTVERALDKLTMLTQQLSWSIDPDRKISPLAGDWQAYTSYLRYQFVHRPDGGIYLSQALHTSSDDFDTDLAAGLWVIFQNIEESVSAAAAAQSAAEAEAAKDTAVAAQLEIESLGVRAVQKVDGLDTGQAALPYGDTSQRIASPDPGNIRFNTQLATYGLLEVANEAGTWEDYVPRWYLEYMYINKGGVIERAGLEDNSGAAKIPSGSTAYRPNPAAGHFRHNTDLDRMEWYSSAVGEYKQLSGWQIDELATGPLVDTDTIDFGTPPFFTDWTLADYDLIMVTAEVTSGPTAGEGLISTIAPRAAAVAAGGLIVGEVVQFGSSTDRIRFALTSLANTGATVAISSSSYTGAITGVYGIKL